MGDRHELRAEGERGEGWSGEGEGEGSSVSCVLS
jgi:hypothetical protein